MDGLEATEINFASLDLGDRFDAEYVSKENLKIESRLKEKNARKFSLYGDFVVSAFYPAATHLYASGDVPFIRCVDCVNYPVISRMQDDKFERIPSSFVLEHGTVDTLSKDEIVITKVGSPCYASIIYEHDEVAISRTVLGVKNIRGINPYYLMVFLRSRYGFKQLLRQRELTIQYQLTLHRVKAIDIFEPSISFQSYIESLAKTSYQQLKQGNFLYAEAESFLLEELGLKDWQPSGETIAVKSFSESFGSTGRLDSEYYQPKYDEALKALKTFKPQEIVPLEKLLTALTNGHTPLRHDLSIGEIPFLTAEHVADFRINYDSDKRVLAEHHGGELARTRLRNGDILVTIKGRIGNAAVVENVPRPSNINQDVALLRIHPDIHPYYFVGYLNSIIGKSFINQICTGQINPFLGLGNLRNIPVPIFDTQKMNALGEELKHKVTQARLANRLAARILEVAKHGVEIAIEQDEAAALAWIDEQTQLMNLA